MYRSRTSEENSGISMYADTSLEIPVILKECLRRTARPYGSNPPEAFGRKIRGRKTVCRRIASRSYSTAYVSSLLHQHCVRTIGIRNPPGDAHYFHESVGIDGRGSRKAGIYHCVACQRTQRLILETALQSPVPTDPGTRGHKR